MIEGFEPRLYQQTILNTATRHNTLVVLPTGLGKTGIALLLSSHLLEEDALNKVVFLAPTKPLVQQHQRTFEKHTTLEKSDMELFTGSVSPGIRENRWKSARVVFSTPQGFENDVISGRIDLDNVSLMIFDEAHRAVGEYAYVFIAEQYMKKARNPRILGLTASPGSNMEKIREVCGNLFIDEIELRTEEDPDVQPYVQEIDVEQVLIDLPGDFQQVIKYLKDCYVSKLKQIKHFGYLSGDPGKYSRKDLLQLQRGVQARMARGDKSFELMKSLSLLAEAMKVQHALILAETQGLESLTSYMKRLQKESENTKTKAVKNLVKDLNFRSALAKAGSLLHDGLEHPKLKEMKRIVAKTLNKNKDAKIIIFNQYRDQVGKIKEVLDELGVKSELFVGQAKKAGMGMSQKEQKETLVRFEEGEFSCLLATSVAEEGLDIPAVDLVLFYEPIPSAVRTVQRRGRTGRQEKGKVVVLITKGTIDEGYRWSAHHKEKRMIKAIKKLKKEFSPEYEMPKITDYVEKLEVQADYREKGAGVIKELSRKGVEVKLKSLEVGDFLLSDEMCVEFKKIPDFVDSVVDGRLLEQLKGLNQYKKPLLILEGDEDIYGQRKIHPNAIRGMLATVMFRFHIPVFQTRDAKDSAGFLKLLAKREQEEKKPEWQFHSAKPLTLQERQEYVVAALPGIGNKLAKPLLKEFCLIRNIANASVEDLQNVDLIGKKKAEKIRELFDTKYEE